MEDEDRFGSFWASLDEDEEDEEIKTPSSALINRKPLLPKTHDSPRQSNTQSFKIERKTPLDYMIRKNQQVKKMQKAKELPTYRDLQQNSALVEQTPPVIRPKYTPTYAQSEVPRPQRTLSQPQKPPQQQYSRQPTQTSLYNRYQVQKKPAPPPQQDNSYLRAQMLKELRSQQQKQPVNLSRERLQPPIVNIPPKPVSYSQQPQQPTYPQHVQNIQHTYSQPNPEMNSYYEDLSEPEIISELELLQSLRNIQDKTKIDVLMQLLDGNWHTDSELLRIAKKSRDYISYVGFGMIICSFEDTITKSFLIKKISSGNTSQFKINDNYLELARSAYSQYKSPEK